MAEPIITQPLEVNDFSGGITDNYIGNPNSSQFQAADNLVLRRYGNKAKLFCRPGSQLYDEDYPRIAANARISHLAENEGSLFQFHGRNAYTITGSGWLTIEGPTNNPVFSAGGSSSYISTDRWNKHLLATNDAYSRPQKIYYTGSTWVSRTLGLPSLIS